jgi:hypothetical protein
MQTFKIPKKLDMYSEHYAVDSAVYGNSLEVSMVGI